MQRITGSSVFFTMGALPVLAALLACIHHIALAQETGEAPADVVDEIVVYGQKQLRELRLEVYRAEDNFYALFNSLNADDEFDVHCVNEAPTGSRIFRRFCRANFENDANAAQIKAMAVGLPFVSAEAEILRKKKIMFDKMEVLATEHPDLHEALTAFDDLRQIYLSEHKKRCEDKSLFCQK